MHKIGITNSHGLLQGNITKLEWLHAVQLEDKQVTMIRDILQENIKDSQTAQHFENDQLKKGVYTAYWKITEQPWLVPCSVMANLWIMLR